MKDFMLLIRGGEMDETNSSPEQMQAHMADWQKWMGGLAEQGILLGGEPLHNEGKTLFEYGKKVVDRPLTEGKELVGGYVMLKADSLDQACELAKGCPGFDLNCAIEVREVMTMDAGQG